MSVPEKRRALGRGLDALLTGGPAAPVRAGAETIFECPIERLLPQKGQPRQSFDEQKLDELAQSIREHGLLEPILVRKALAPPPGMSGDCYEIIAGERRWRASQRAGLRDVLVIVKDVSPSEAFELALIENVQREDLNPVEAAEALDRLIKEHGYTQEALAERLGKNRTTITNSLRLLKLPARVRQLVIEGALSEGHARALLGVQDPKGIDAIAEKVVRGALSVRETEKLVRARAQQAEARAGDSPAGDEPGRKTPSVRDLEERLSRRFGTKVEVRHDKGKGELAIQYASLDELDRLLDLLMK